MSLNAGASSSHFGGSLSTVEILTCLFEEIMKVDSPTHYGVKEIDLY